MESGSDTFATLMWGLKRYALLVIAMMLFLGVLVPLMLSQRTVEYTATAQVGPNGPLVLSNIAPLPRIAESVFNNGAVEQDLRTYLKQPTGNIIPSEVRLIAAQDNVVLEIVATAPTAKEAIEIANRAASTFLLQLGGYSGPVAPFVFQHHAQIAKKVPKFAGGSVSVVFGLLGGLLAGVAVVGLVLVIRRPVVEASTAQDVTGAPVIGRITLPRHGPPTKSDGRAIGLLCRRLLGRSAATIHVAAPNHAQADQLATSMQDAFGQIASLRRNAKRNGNGGGGGGGNNRPSVPEVVAPDDAEAWMASTDDTSYTVLLAPEGISTRKLRLFAEGHNTGSPTGVVLVSTHRGSRVSTTDED